MINNVTRAQASQAISAGAVDAHRTLLCMENDEDAEEKGVDELLSPILATESDDNMALVVLRRELIGNVAKIFKPL